ncbi:MAG TPA: AI-2E family transporter [Gammaproteobacteria bacterium]|nr:AI-2E family transporter [Gammaproteobacteria bacterium]
MQNVITRWINKYLSDPEAIILGLLLIIGFGIVIFIGDMLAPLLISIVLAYFLEGLVKMLEKRNISRISAVLLTYIPSLIFMAFLLLAVLPMLLNQITQLAQTLPDMISKGQDSLFKLPELYPDFVSEQQIAQLLATIKTSVGSFAQNLLSISLSSMAVIFTVLIYLILIPVLIFFLLKDKEEIIEWFQGLLPQERKVATQVWHEMDQQIGNYVRGKFLEVFVVGVVTYITFAIMGLNFAALLAALVGLSVIIPYIGAVAVTFPVILIAYFQWGWGPELAYLVTAYLVIQALDGNVLVPLLFSEAVNLHPIAIIVAVLFFGGIWGVWGVFFAIPLATLVKAVIDAWPRTDIEIKNEERSDSKL